jgi:hypothetical protein
MTEVKRQAFITATMLLGVFSCIVYGAKRSLYQIAYTYVCEDDAAMAELTAKVKVNRKELLTVSYCTCEGVSQGKRDSVANMKCEPPKDTVFSCSCIGKNNY